MVTLSMPINRADADQYGRITIPDGICAQAVPSGHGYGKQPCKIISGGKTFNAIAVYGRISSYIIVPAFATDKKYC